MRRKLPILFFLLPALLAQAGGESGMGNARGRTRGKKPGTYTLVVAGQWNGNGAAVVTDVTVSIVATVRRPDGTTVPLVLSGLPLANDRFTGAGVLGGTPCTVNGRVDLPSATDDEQADEPSVTGRISATVRDATGHTLRIVGIQDAPSRGGNGRGNGGNGNGNGNGNGGNGNGKGG
jgi:hypothetical protein